MKKRKAIWPRPKTGQELTHALSGYQDVALIHPCDVLICKEEGKPFKLEIKHTQKATTPVKILEWFTKYRNQLPVDAIRDFAKITGIDMNDRQYGAWGGPEK